MQICFCGNMAKFAVINHKMREYGAMLSAAGTRRILAKRAIKLAVDYGWILVNALSVRATYK